MLIVLTVLLGLLAAVDATSNITIDNTSPLVVFSPTPCFQQNVSDCSPEWQLFETTSDFNGSSTSTTGPDAALDLTVVPRVSLVFQGSAVIFVPGQHSTAQATVVIDNLSSILVDTSTNAFSGTGLDPLTSHTITVTFVPSDSPTSLQVDYFVIELPDANTTTTSTASSSLTPTLIPTTLPPTPTPTPTPTSLPTALPSSSSTTLSHWHPPDHTTPPTQQSTTTTIPSGTIAAVSVSAALFLLLAALAWLLTLRRRRRRAALQREKAILYDLRLPSEHTAPERRISRVRRWGEEQLDRLRDRDRDRIERGQGLAHDSDLPWDATQRREKGKERERPTWRDSVLPPVHYTPWR